MIILAVVVRYKTPLEESETIRTLANSFSNQPELTHNAEVLVWDNSPVALQNPQFPFPVSYHHTGKNEGVAGAYNRAMRIAVGRGIPWMLLLDQDTSLPDDFLPRMLEYSRTHLTNEDIAAIVPFLLDDKVPSSPVAVHCGWNKPILPPRSGIYAGEAFAANSGTLLRVSALREIDGYDEAFWLDLSDVVMFRRLYTRHKQIFIAGDLRVQHKITNNDYDGSMSIQRYLNFIWAEGAYWDLYRGSLPRAIYTARLFGRVIRQYRRYRNKAFSGITLRYLWQRLIVSKRVRLEAWKRQSIKRDLPAIASGKVVG